MIKIIKYDGGINMLITLEQMEKVKGLDKLYKELQAIGYINLKLYDVSIYLYDLDIPNDERYGLFDCFCQEQYELLKQEIYDYNSDIEFEHIRNTSSFHIVNDGIDGSFYEDDYPWNQYIWRYSYIEHVDYSEMIVKTILESDNIEVLNNNLKVLDCGEFDLQEVINDIFEFMDDEIESIAEILSLHKLIQNFKDNQLEYFKEWLEYRKDLIEEDIITEMNQYADLFLESNMIDFFDAGKVKGHTTKIENKEAFVENLLYLDYSATYKLYQSLNIARLEKGLIFEYDGKIYTLI